MIFDQYSRYKACSDLLRQTDYVASNSVLDIGSGPECLFGQFLPDAAMNYIDPLIPIDSGQGRITGNIFASELDGQTFDCVTAVDVLEHVPPEYRQMFLKRISSLSKKTLILGFPTSDSSDALETDKAINEQYRTCYGHEYPWLEEHYRYGLPSLADTVEHLSQLGWHCQSVGHGHAPWLRELLGFMICLWDIPSFKKIVLEISDKFNRELYFYDFRPPYYRQFVIASRNPLPPIIAPIGTDSDIVAESVFRVLIEDAYRLYFSASMRQFTEDNSVFIERDAAITERDAAMTERDAAITERDAAMTERDAAITERDAAMTERDMARSEREDACNHMDFLLNSSSWRLTKPLRFTARLIRYGFTSEDRRHIIQELRQRYHQLPLPSTAKKLISLAKRSLFGSTFRLLRRGMSQVTQIHAPSIRPLVQEEQKPDYIVWGVIDWHFRHQRPQQLALALAGTGRRVFYVSPNLIDNEPAGFRPMTVDISSRIFQINLFSRGAPSIYSSTPSLETVDQLRRSLGEVLDWANCQQIISLVQHPFWYNVASAIPNSRLVYDCMDHHEGFGNNAQSLLELERSLLGEAELVITTSSWLDKAVTPHSNRRGLIRNAGDFKHFSKLPNNIYRDSQGRRVIGYYGAIAEWFDADLVEAVAKQHPDCAVLLIGADTANVKNRLNKLPNVTFTGEVPYNQLPYYLHGIAVCLLPFKVIPLTLATNPVKVYEYLSAGKPVVTMDLPEMVQFDGLVYKASDKDQFLAAVAQILRQSESEDLVERRKKFASGQTWKHRGDALIGLVESGTRDPKVSVVVVTYNNLNLTRACLASIDEHSQYEHLEVIVVDNASTDGSREFLGEWEDNHHNHKLILNDDNKGFAAANNQGLAIATGDYLVLLNNDTYVTPGWTRTLSKHLQRDQTIGLIGPVTNNIGNEAKIDILYTNMSEMLIKSAAYTRRHIGRLTPLRTAAFFCVMMARTTFEAIGPLDEAFGRGFFEDDDYCRRIEKAGLRVVCAEDVFVHHNLSASFDQLNQKERQKLFEENKKIYEAKWGDWIPHGYRKNHITELCARPTSEVFANKKYINGQCNVCGKQTRFFYQEEALWRESLNCEHCRTTSRYRSIARGILLAINELTGNEAASLATLSRISKKRLRVYDTQPPFYYESCAYPLPDLLKATGWIDVELSQYKPKKPMGKVLVKGVTNQNLECLNFDSESFDVVITSDVMEHVRLDDCAHKEIYRVLKPGGIYIFTVPHDRSLKESIVRVQVTDPLDSSKDIKLLEPEYHGDTNNDEGCGVLAFRTYGRDIETQLKGLEFEVDYARDDIEPLGILNTELYYCRKLAY